MALENARLYEDARNLADRDPQPRRPRPADRLLQPPVPPRAPWRAYVGEQRGPVPIGASLGIATFPADGRSATEPIAAADEALYPVKRSGGHDIARAGDAVA